MRTVKVPLGERSYQIQIAGGLLESCGRRIAALGHRGRCAIITDDCVAPLYLEKVMASMRGHNLDPIPIILPRGETTKKLVSVEKCYREFASHRLERKSAVIALGGGVIGDLAGFAAATYLRGVPFIQVPTTLLAQVDSSVGGKVGVNLPQGKNLVGAFYQPDLVLCDSDTLTTLDPRELRAGIAEVIKYGVIHDSRFFSALEKNMDSLLQLDPGFTGKVISRCCAIKSHVVEHDEKEGGLRAILNFGHTIGHAIEAISSYSQYLHGEAIAIGMVKAAALSARMTGFPHSHQDRLKDLLQKSGLPTHIHLTSAQEKKLIAAMSLDKKVKDGEVRFVLARSIGAVDFDCRVPEELVLWALRQEF